VLNVNMSNDRGEPGGPLLLVDDSAETTQLFARLLTDSIGRVVTTVSHVEDVPTVIEANPTFDAAVVDLSFAHQQGNGLDVLEALSAKSPTTKLIVLTTGDGWALDLLALAWDAYELATAISKTASVEHQVRSISEVLHNGRAPIDGVLRAHLPEQRDPNRTRSSYRRLVRHQGHKKLWSALLRCSPSAEYAELAALCGLSLNTVRNYRAELLPELAFHRLTGPTMQEMRAFALLARPLLAPFLLDPDSPT
jgi:DNA-binding NarL/FixJ family response regulator